MLSGATFRLAVVFLAWCAPCAQVTSSFRACPLRTNSTGRRDEVLPFFEGNQFAVAAQGRNGGIAKWTLARSPFQASSELTQLFRGELRGKPRPAAVLRSRLHAVSGSPLISGWGRNRPACDSRHTRDRAGKSDHRRCDVWGVCSRKTLCR